MKTKEFERKMAQLLEQTRLGRGNQPVLTKAARKLLDELADFAQEKTECGVLETQASAAEIFRRMYEELRAAPDEAVRNETALEWLPGLRYAVEKRESSGLY